MRRLVLFAGVVTLLCLGLMLAARAVGVRIYEPPALLDGLSACASPCWNGIVVGETSIAVADRIMHEQRYGAVGAYDALNLVYRVGVRDCWSTVTMFDRKVVGIRFSACGTIRLGDLALLLGMPDRLTFTAGVGDTVSWNAALFDATVTNWRSPFARVTDFGLTVPSSSGRLTGTPWHGFVPFWRYCQLEQVTYYCPNPAS